MAILLKKKNQLLQSLSSNFNFKFDLRRKLNTSCSWASVIDNPSLHVPKRHHHCLKTTAADKLLLKHFLGNDGKTGTECNFTRLTPENFSAAKLYGFRNRWLESYLESAPTCDGLLYVYNKSGEAAIWNPSTEEGIVLPSHAKSANCIVDACALGFDSKSQDYKVVRFSHNCVVEGQKYCWDEDCRTGVELYSFKTNSWKILDYRDVYDFRSPSIYVNGCSYWLLDESCILSFNFGDETLSSLALPDTGKLKGSYAFDLVEFDGSLGGVVYPRFDTDHTFDRFGWNEFWAKKWFELWIMKGDGLWTRELVVPPTEAKRPMGFWRNGHLFFENASAYGPLLAYDVRSNDFMKLHISGDRGKMELIPYVESTLPMNDQLQL